MLPKTIFHDQEVETEKHPTSGIVGIDAQNYCQHRVASVGQNFVIDKFNEIMLKKRKRTDSRELSNELPSKRQKRSTMQKDVDTVVAQSEYIKRYINQRQLVTDS